MAASALPESRSSPSGSSRSPSSWPGSSTTPRGSRLLAILAHASINTFALDIMKMFPAYATSQVNLLLGVGTFAVLLILLTRGRLGYEKYLAEVSNPDQ
jgi:hypothetical protein